MYGATHAFYLCGQKRKSVTNALIKVSFFLTQAPKSGTIRLFDISQTQEYINPL